MIDMLSCHRHLRNFCSTFYIHCSIDILKLVNEHPSCIIVLQLDIPGFMYTIIGI